jgi:tRNA/tmRNA/rRNA uracil-C5-methylase (TrmA/RlmC/RlmD family)
LRETLFDTPERSALLPGLAVATPTFFFSPAVFRQANLGGFAAIVARLATAEVVPEASVVCELYAGIGLVGLSLLGALGPAHVAELRCSDENPNNVRAFDMAVRSLGPDLAARAAYTALPAADALAAGEARGASVLIVDPPRKGLDQTVLDALCDPRDPRARDVRTLVYISCGFEALQWQLPVLEKSGWRLDFAEGFVLFPGSDHLETLCVLRR